jgi:hypothetical protein
MEGPHDNEPVNEQDNALDSEYDNNSDNELDNDSDNEPDMDMVLHIYNSFREVCRLDNIFSFEKDGSFFIKHGSEDEDEFLIYEGDFPGVYRFLFQKAKAHGLVDDSYDQCLEQCILKVQDMWTLLSHYRAALIQNSYGN